MKKGIFTLLAMLGLMVGSFAQNVVITEINYNSPGPSVDTFEFVELYNKGAAAVDLEGWQFNSGINYIFPAYTLNPGEYVVVAYDAPKFNQAFGFTPLAWDPSSFNALNNTGEKINLVDNNGVFVDSVRYSSSSPWPAAANGQGSSLVLCDFNADNSDAANWMAASVGTGYVAAGIEIKATPGEASGCATGPVVSFAFPSFNVLENAGNLFVSVYIIGGNASPTSVTVSVSPTSTATAPGDYTASLPTTVTFAGGVSSETQTVPISLVSDTDIEPSETLVLNLTNTTNGATINTASFTLNILDDDTPVTGALLITGVIDAQPSNVGARGIELRALQDIPDLSIYGIGSASNGGGSDGEEVSLPAVPLAAGECVYVAADSALFLTYFGFDPIADGAGANNNGDDAIELFENGIVVDVFGEITYASGSTLPWNYLDGWAYRNDGTGPDGSVFNLGNWTIAANALNGGATNNDAPIPFPVCSYSTVAPVTAELSDDDFVVAFEEQTNLNVLVNDVLPVPITSFEIISGPSNGTATVNGLIDITYTPESGYCGDDEFTYEICDAGGCDQAVVTITVECPTTYPAYDIEEVTTVNSQGVPDSLGVTCELRGIVYGIDFQGVNAQGEPLNAVQFYLNDGTGSISIFGSDNFGYVVDEGDEVIIRGEIGNFNCLTQLSDLDTIIFVSANNPLLPPAITTFLNENLESELVKFTNMELVNPSSWGPPSPTSTGFNAEIKSVINPTAEAIVMRIDNDCELFNMSAPSGAFHATGIAGQFVQGGGGGCVDGYQFSPRYAADIELLDATKESLLEGKISFYPNPVGSQLYVKSDIILDGITVANALGQVVMQQNKPGNQLEVGHLEAGLYLITFRAEGSILTSKFVKD